MLTKKQKEKIESIAEKYGLKMVLLFGSQVSGKTKPDSDFDVAYLPQKPLTSEQKFELNDELTNVFDFRWVDQVNIKNASTLLMYEISNNSHLLFGEDIDYIKFKNRAFKLFMDSASLFRLQDSLVKKKHKMLGQKIYAQ